MPKENLQPTIYVSYSWTEKSEEIVDAIEKEFKKRGVRIIRDKNDLKYKGSIKTFMEQIGKSKYVIIILSNAYLQSENCMFELLQIFKNQDFYDRIFPLVLDDVKIAKAKDRLELVKYWENETDYLDKNIRELKQLANIQGVTDDLNLYSEIRNNVAMLTNILKDINTLNTDKHISSNFNQLFGLIEDKIKTDKGKPKTKWVKKIVVAVVVIALLFLAFQVINWKPAPNDINNKIKLSDAKKKDKNSLPPTKLDTFTTIKNEPHTIAPDTKLPNKTYDVILVVPAIVKKNTVYVDGKKANIVQRTGFHIIVRVNSKNSSHRFEISNGTENCFSERLITKDSIKVPIVCNF